MYYRIYSTLYSTAYYDYGNKVTLEAYFSKLKVVHIQFHAMLHVALFEILKTFDSRFETILSVYSNSPPVIIINSFKGQYMPSIMITKYLSKTVYLNTSAY